MEFVASHFFPRRFRAAAWPRNLQQILAHFAPGGTIISRPLCQRGCELCHVWFKVVAPKTLMIVSENGRIAYFQTNSSDQLCCQSLPPILSRIYLWLTVWYKDCFAMLHILFWASDMKHTETCIRGPCRPAKGESSLPQWGKLQHASILRIVFDGREQKQWVMASRCWVPRYDWIRAWRWFKPLPPFTILILVMILFKSQQTSKNTKYEGQHFPQIAGDDFSICDS